MSKPKHFIDPGVARRAGTYAIAYEYLDTQRAPLFYMDVYGQSEADALKRFTDLFMARWKDKLVIRGVSLDATIAKCEGIENRENGIAYHVT